MIPIYDQGVAMKGRRTALTVVAAGGHFSKVPAPDTFAFQAVTMHPARAVIDVEMFAISHRRGGSVPVIAVIPFMGQFFSCSLAPENLTGGPVDAEHIKTVNDPGLRIGNRGQGRCALNLNARLGNGFRGGRDSGGLSQ